MSTVNGFQVGSETLKYNYESLDNYNTPNFSTSSSTTYAVGDYVMYNGKIVFTIDAEVRIINPTILIKIVLL